MSANTPTTDSATHDDWSGGTEATDPEVCRKMETLLRELVAFSSIHLEQPHDMSENDFYQLRCIIDSAREFLK